MYVHLRHKAALTSTMRTMMATTHRYIKWQSFTNRLQEKYDKNAKDAKIGLLFAFRTLRMCEGKTKIKRI